MSIQKYDPDVWTQLQYHNEKIYHNFEFFIKVTLAISGGLAYLAVNKISGNAEIVSYMVRLGAIFELLVGIVASLAISFHVKSRIKRYENPPAKICKAMWGSMEPYLVIFILLISLIISYVAWFKISGKILVAGA